MAWCLSKGTTLTYVKFPYLSQQTVSEAQLVKCEHKWNNIK